MCYIFAVAFSCIFISKTIVNYFLVEILLTASVPTYLYLFAILSSNAGLMDSVSLEIKNKRRQVNTTVVCPALVRTPILGDFNINFR